MIVAGDGGDVDLHQCKDWELGDTRSQHDVEKETNEQEEAFSNKYLDQDEGGDVDLHQCKDWELGDARSQHDVEKETNEQEEAFSNKYLDQDEGQVIGEK